MVERQNKSVQLFNEKERDLTAGNEGSMENESDTQTKTYENEGSSDTR